jgi:hypothetical protein
LRIKAEEYARTEGRKFNEKVIINPGGSGEDSYLVIFVPNPRSTPVLESFWGPHLRVDETTTIIYTEPFFFHDTHQRIWIRFLDVNYPSERRPTFLKKNGQFVDAYGYVPTGEMHAVLGMYKWLSERKVPVDHLAVHDEDDGHLPKTNIVLFGSARSSPMMRLLQSDSGFFHYSLGNQWIDVRPSKNGVADAERILDREPEGAHNTRHVHALVTRSRHPDGRHLVTTIAANHTRAVQRMFEVLIDGDALHDVVSSEIVNGREHFQFIFEIEVWGRESQTGGLKLVRTWPTDLMPIDS